MTADAILARLPDRQRDACKMAAAGLSNQEIARRLEISEQTVKVHLKAAFKRLGISRRTQLVGLLGPNAAAIDPGSLGAEQRRLADLIAQGLSDREIAEALGLSEALTKTRVRLLLAAVGAPRRVTLANWWLAAQGAPLRNDVAVDPPPTLDGLIDGANSARDIAAAISMPMPELAERLLGMLRDLRQPHAPRLLAA